MNNLAVIKNLIVTNIIVANDPADFPDYVDVTSIPCGIGWTDNEDGTFSAPAAIVNPASRIISTRAFMQRLSQAERIALRGSADDIVIDMMEDLRMASYVDLDVAMLAVGLGYIESLGLIATSQLTDMSIDGTAAEQYNGIL